MPKDVGSSSKKSGKKPSKKSLWLPETGGELMTDVVVRTTPVYQNLRQMMLIHSKDAKEDVGSRVDQEQAERVLLSTARGIITQLYIAALADHAAHHCASCGMKGCRGECW